MVGTWAVKGSVSCMGKLPVPGDEGRASQEKLRLSHCIDVSRRENVLLYEFRNDHLSDDWNSFAK